LWDAETRTLFYDAWVVKRHWGPPDDETRLLDALQEQCCAHRIDDPLPQQQGIDPTARLREAVQALNSRHDHPGLRFEVDDTGRGLLWSWRPPVDGLPSSSPVSQEDTCLIMARDTEGVAA
jgi:hypothetical protein